MELFINMGINKYIIKLIKAKLPFYRPIYAMSLIKLETLKIYIKIYLKTRFILFFKSLTDILILFDKKLNSNLQLYIDY